MPQSLKETVKARNSMSARNGNGNGSSVVPWILAVFGIAGGIVSFVWGQINPKTDIGAVESRLEDQSKQAEQRQRDANAAFDKRIDAINTSITNLLLTLAEYKEFKVRKDNDTIRQDDQIRRLLQTRLNRDEHVKDLTAITDRLNGQRDALSKLQDSVGGGGVGKQLDNLQAQLVKQSESTAAQIAELRRALDMRTPTVPVKTDR